MPDFLVPYGSTLAACVCLAGIYVAQALVADVAGIRAGHVPGMPITTGHADFLFRATRAQANTNESLPAFVLLSLSAVLLGASCLCLLKVHRYWIRFGGPDNYAAPEPVPRHSPHHSS